MSKYLLEIKGLKTFFYLHHGVVRAVDDVSLTVTKGEAIGIVGESGCGKSVLARSIMRLIPNPPGRIVSGRINFRGKDVLGLNDKEMQSIRGNAISMVFQEPMTALNPVYTIGAQLSEIFKKHLCLGKTEALAKSLEMLRLVRIPAPESRLKNYPFQLSGGMRQRVVIAMALACRPNLLLADEPTTALDVTIQAQILELINGLRKETGTSMILITHDLGVIAETVKRVFVMYAGRVVEQVSVDDLFNEPLHPYTRGLIDSIPSIEGDQGMESGPLMEIPGLVPDLSRLPKGCYFEPRCPQSTNICTRTSPEMIQHKTNHWVRCWQYS